MTACEASTVRASICAGQLTPRVVNRKLCITFLSGVCDTHRVQYYPAKIQHNLCRLSTKQVSYEKSSITRTIDRLHRCGLHHTASDTVHNCARLQWAEEHTEMPFRHDLDMNRPHNASLHNRNTRT